MENILETFLNCQVKFTPWRWRQSKEFDAIIRRDNYLVDLKKLIGFGLFLWKGVKTCKLFWGYYWLSREKDWYESTQFPGTPYLSF